MKIKTLVAFILIMSGFMQMILGYLSNGTDEIIGAIFFIGGLIIYFLRDI